MNVSIGDQLVYDNHNLIYCYENDDWTISFFKAKGFRQGDLNIPVPHQHGYHREEENLLAYFQGKKSPLPAEHDG